MNLKGTKLLLHLDRLVFLFLKEYENVDSALQRVRASNLFLLRIHSSSYDL